MLDGIRIFSSDKVWRHILGDLGAVVLDVMDNNAINFDDIAPNEPVSIDDLKTLILNNLNNNTKILQSVFGKNVPGLSDVQERVIVALVQSGGMTGAELKRTLDYMPIATHTIDTAIYNLRKLYGRNFIILDKGVYKIGTV
ncbi:MAG: hypothetical protein KBT14_01560 [Proteobacteria bacterium]|nr:hypothetical protein [Candidatus Enterousia onthequi]